MKRSFILLILVICFTFILPTDVSARRYRSSSSDVYVNGYYRKDGTYVQPHYRSAPDGITSNNYSCIDYGRCGDGSSGSRGGGGGDVSSSYIYVPIPTSTPIIHPDNPVTTSTISFQQTSTEPFHNVYVIWNGTENTDYSISLTKNAGSDPGPKSDTTSPTFAFHNIQPGKWYVNLKSRVGGQWSKITYWSVDIPQRVAPTRTQIAIPTSLPTPTLVTSQEQIHLAPDVLGEIYEPNFWERIMLTIYNFFSE